ncbi:MAG: DUF2341 domain-containing protein, partial [Chitinispirillaceae bacterium]|nr:DUF2341 domain-containing protein [Chitinispirillaceae bacterium]
MRRHDRLLRGFPAHVFLRCVTALLMSATSAELLAADYFWDISTSSGYQAGSGTWGSNNYWTLNGTSLVAWPGAGNSATFAGSDGTWAITVSGTQNVDSIYFGNSTYTLSSGTVNLGSKSGITLASGKTATISAVIAGTGGLSVKGGTASLSTLNLSGANTYTGVTTLTGPNLRCNVSTLANGGSNSAIGAASSSASNLVLNGGQLRYTGSGASTDRLFTLNTTTSFIYSSGSGAMNFTNTGSIAFSGSDTRTLEFGGAYSGSSTFAPVIGDGTGGATSITKTGSPNSWIFTGNNTYTGATTISAGTIQIGNNGTTGAIAGNISNSDALVFYRSNDLTYGGVISGSGTVTKNGAGALTFTGTNTYTGTTTISAGTLQIGNNGTTGAISNSSNVTNGGTLTFYRSDDYTYGGVISSTGAVTKNGAGTVTLSNTNTYTGTTTISAGTLLITGSTASGSAVTVADGATLGGTGTVSGTVAANGAISPGTSGYGTLTIGNSLTFSGTGSFVGTLGGTTAGTNYDQAVMSTGTLTLGSATLDLTLAYAPTATHTYTIINNAGSNAVSGTFSGYAQGSTVQLTYSSTSYDFTISYIGGTGNDVVLTCSGVTPPEDYGDWDYSQVITLNTTASGANVSGNVLDFPVLLRLNPGNFDDFTHTLAGGADVRFAKIDGTHLDYCIERWLDGGGNNDTAEIWIKIDTVYGNSASQGFVMYWGKTGKTSQSNSSAVFSTDNDFSAVYFLDQSSGAAIDYTANGKDGTESGSVPNQQAGMIGKGQSFDGNGDYFDAGNGDPFDMSTDDKVTIMAWVKPAGNAVAGTIEGIASKWQWNTGSYQEYELGESSSSGFFFAISSTGSNYEFVYDVGGPPTNGTWYHVAGTMDGSKMVLFINGSPNDSSTDMSSIYHTESGSFRIGLIDDDNGSYRQYYNGTIDQVVLSKTNRSAHWIRLCFENQKAAQTLVEMSGRFTWDNSTGDGFQAVDGTWGTHDYWSIDGKTLFAWPGAGNTAVFAGGDGTYAITVSGTQSVDKIIFSNSGYTLGSGT